MDQATELSRLAPAGTFVESVTVTSYQRDEDREVANIHTHFIRQFTFHQFFQVIAHAERVFGAALSLNIDLEKLDLTNLVTSIQSIMQLMAFAGADIEQLITLAINKDTAYLNTLDPDDGIKLAIAVFKVNKDFFVQRILPMMESFKPEAKEAATTEVSDSTGATS